MRMDVHFAMSIVEALADNPRIFPPSRLCPEREPDSSDFGESWNRNAQVQKYLEHCRLLAEEGLVEFGPYSEFGHPTRVTYNGHVRLDEWKHPARYWLKRNWFPSIVAGATIAVSVSGIVFNACA